MRRSIQFLALLTLAILVIFGTAQAVDVALQKYPDVLAAKIRLSGTDTFDLDVTISSPYDIPKRYADGFRVMGKDGTVYGERTLFHDHANEQPFTRDLHGVKIPHNIQFVIIQARDKQFGYGGKSVESLLPGR